MSSEMQPMCSTVKWRDGEKQMKSFFFHFLVNKTLCDCTLKAEGKEIYIHRVILASASLYFRKKFTSLPTQNVINIPYISYMNLCLVVKFAYTGEVTMAENRLAGFLEDAKALGMLGADGYEIVHKPRSKAKRKKKRATSKVNINNPHKRAAVDDLQHNDSKKRKKEVPENDWSDESWDKHRVDDRKRKPDNSVNGQVCHGDAQSDCWEQQTHKKPRVAIIACQFCLQSFSDLNALDLHEAFCTETIDSEEEFLQ